MDSTRSDARKEVKAIADKQGMLSSSYYYYYYFPINTANPKHTREGSEKKYPSEHYKFAVDKVANLDFADILNGVKEIVEGLKSILQPLTDKRATDFLGAWQVVEENLSSEESKKSHFKSAVISPDNYSFLTPWKDLQATLAIVMSNPKDLKLGVNGKGLCHELSIWLDGIFVHACVYARILQVQKILEEHANNKDMAAHPLKDKKIDHQNPQFSSHIPEALPDIPLAYAKVFTAIEAWDGKDALPVVLMLLNNIRKVAVAKSPSSLGPLDFAIKLLIDTNERQHWGACASNIKYAGSIESGLLKDLAELIKKIESLQLIEEFIPLCRLLMLFMEGMYVRTYNLPEADPENAQFHLISGLYKRDVGVYYLYASAVIRRKLVEFEQRQQQALSHLGQVVQAPLVPSIAVSSAAAAAATSAAVVYGVNIEETYARLDLLSCPESVRSDLKISCLRNLVGNATFNFTPDEVLHMQSLKPTLIRKINEYISNVYRPRDAIRWMGIPVISYLAQKTHEPQATEFMSDYCGTNETDPTRNKTPIEVLRAAFRLYDGIAGSTDLSPKLEEVFTQVYDNLYHFHQQRLARVIPYPQVPGATYSPQQRFASSSYLRAVGAAPQMMPPAPVAQQPGQGLR